MFYNQRKIQIFFKIRFLKFSIKKFIIVLLLYFYYSTFKYISTLQYISEF